MPTEARHQHGFARPRDRAVGFAHFWVLRSVLAVATVMTPTTRALGDAGTESRFVAWLKANPQVLGVSVVQQQVVQHKLFVATRVRVITKDGSLICVVYRKRSACYRDPAPARHLWTAKVFHRKSGAMVMRVVLGPVSGDQASVYEFRFPGATVHRSKPLRFRRGYKESDPLPSWVRSWFHQPYPSPFSRRARPAAKNAPPLPLVSGPPWLDESPLLRVSLINGGEGVVVSSAKETLACVRVSSGRGWRCLPGMTVERLAVAEPKLPSIDKRRKPTPPSVADVQTHKDGNRWTVLVEWEWMHETVANTSRAAGSFVELLTLSPAQPPRSLGFVRTGYAILRAYINGAHLRAKLVDSNCFELSRSVKKHPRRHPPLHGGRYCVKGGKLCRMQGGGTICGSTK